MVGLCRPGSSCFHKYFGMPRWDVGNKMFRYFTPPLNLHKFWLLGLKIKILLLFTSDRAGVYYATLWFCMHYFGRTNIDIGAVYAASLLSHHCPCWWLSRKRSSKSQGTSVHGEYKKWCRSSSPFWLWGPLSLHPLSLMKTLCYNSHVIKFNL